MTTATAATINRSKPTSGTRKKTTKRKTQPKVEPVLEIPAIEGMQSGHLYYSIMVPVRLLSKLFIFDDECLPPDMRAQRLINMKRANAFKDYVNSADPYTISAVSVVFDPGPEGFNFTPMREDLGIGVLKIPLDSRMLIIDGQHRIHGLKKAAEEDPKFNDDTLSCCLFYDFGLKTSQQRFHDLNYYASKPTKSINLLYNHRGDHSKIVHDVLKEVPVFKNYTDCERTSLQRRSAKLFTLNAIDEATNYLLNSHKNSSVEFKTKLAIDYWTAIYYKMKGWQNVYNKDIAPGEVRNSSICGHAICLTALGVLGQSLVIHDDWRERLNKLDFEKIDWLLNNSEWNDLIIFGGRIHKSKAVATEFAYWIINNAS